MSMCRRITMLMSLSLFHQPCPACLVNLTWIVCVIGNGRHLKLVDEYLSSNISSAERDVNIHLAEAWTAFQLVIDYTEI